MTQRRLSVVYVTRKWAPAIGGMETYSLRLTEELRNYANVSVIALRGRDDGSPPSMLSLAAFPFRFITTWLSVGRDADILHVGDMALWPFALVTKLMGKRPAIILSAHGTDVSYPRRGGLKGRLYGAYLKLGSSLLRSATVIANSHATEAVAGETGWSTSKVVPLATDLRPKARARHADHHLLFVGRLIPLKGLSWFVREVLPSLPDGISLRVAGTIWNASEGDALAAPRVEYLGALGQEDLCEAYARAACVVIPNIELATGEYEGFGLVAPEAAACGGIVVAARCGGLVDAVIDKSTGFLVEPGNAQEWARTIRDILSWSDARRDAFVSEAMEKSQQTYSWDRVACQTLGVYEEVAGK